VRASLAAHANVNFRDTSGDSPLIGAAATCHADVVKALIAAGADVNGRSRDPAFKMNDGNTPLMAASGSAEDGCPEVAKLLIASGADVNAHTPDGLTALDDAANEGRLTTSQLLLAAGADVNTPGPGGMTPLSFASGDPPAGASPQGRTAVAHLLREHGAHT
jgi:ankyrin repeat protein